MQCRHSTIPALGLVREPIDGSCMSEEQRVDFLNQLQLFAFEEAPLSEIPSGSTDLVRSGRIEHRPWLLQDCAAVLVRWFDQGLVGLFRYSPAATGGLWAPQRRVV
jgi:hypothetical protein